MARPYNASVRKWFKHIFYRDLINLLLSSTPPKLSRGTIQSLHSLCNRGCISTFFRIPYWPILRRWKAVTTDSYQLIWRTKWQMRVNIFSCSSKGLWDDLDAEWQQSTRLWLVSQHMSHCITLHLSAILGGSYLATLSVASTNHVGKVTQQNKSVVDNRM